MQQMFIVGSNVAKRNGYDNRLRAELVVSVWAL